MPNTSNGNVTDAWVGDRQEAKGALSMCLVPVTVSAGTVKVGRHGRRSGSQDLQSKKDARGL